MDLVTNFKYMTKKDKILALGVFVALTMFVIAMIVNPAWADADYKGEINGVLGSMIEIVGSIFIAVGVILTVYSVGTLILAFKNEDADSKSRASTMLVVGVCLMALPTVVESLGLKNKLAGGSGDKTPGKP